MVAPSSIARERARTRLGRGVPTAGGVLLCIISLAAAAVLGSQTAWERTLGDLPRARGLDYAARTAFDLQPLREGYITDVLGGAFGVRSTIDRSPGGIPSGSDPSPAASGAHRRRITPGNKDQPWPGTVFGVSTSPSISADGRFVAYHSNDTRTPGLDAAPCAASPPGATTGSLYWGELWQTISRGGLPCLQIVVQDLRAGDMAIASVSDTGEQANANALEFMLSGNGRYVVFSSYASNLVPNDTNDAADVFVRDLRTGHTELISVSYRGGQIQRHPDDHPGALGAPIHQDVPDVRSSIDARMATISHDGRYVLFESSSHELVPGDEPMTVDVFLRDRMTETTERMSLSASGEPASDADVHADNRERLMNTRTMSAYPCMSPNARFVVFRSLASNLVPGDRNAGSDVFLRDRLTGSVELVSVSSAGEQANGDSTPANGSTGGMDLVVPFWAIKNCVADNGRHVVFESWATSLVDGDTNDQSDVFLRDRTTGGTSRVNVSIDGRQASFPPNGAGYGSSLSPDGRFVAFVSYDDLDGSDTNRIADVFLYEIARESLARISATVQSETLDGDSGCPSMSFGADAIAFTSFQWQTATYSVHIFRRDDR